MRKLKLIIFYSLLFINFLFLSFSLLPGYKTPFNPARAQQNSIILSPISQTVTFNSQSQILPVSNSIQNNLPEDEKIYNILLLGLDGRKGDKKQRCDAIHLFSLDLKNEKLTIISVPRGTKISMGNVASGSSYLANACSIVGIDLAVKNIEKITGIHPDATVKVGFSQVLGILRTLNFDTSPTLQFLRNRRYGIGDYQRSHNQALFFKDAIVNYFADFNKLPKEIRFLIYRMADTDLDFELANKIFEEIDRKKIYQNPDNIILISKPYFNPYIKEIHLTDTNYSNDNNWWQDADYQKYQQNLELYLENLTTSVEKDLDNGRLNNAYQKIKIPFSQQLWLQIENEKKRDQLHFSMLKEYVLSNIQEDNINLISDFIREMEMFGKTELEQQGSDLLDLLSA